MNRNLLIALALPSMMFYQSNAPILYSSEKLIIQVREEQAQLAFDLSETGNTLIVANERIEENETTVFSDNTEPAESTNQIREETGDTSEIEESTSSIEKKKKESTRVLPKTNTQAMTRSEKKNSTKILETIEQKINALPFTNPPSDDTGERELVRMLANMSGTILYGTKKTEINKQEYLIF